MEFCAHTVRAFAISVQPTRVDRAKESLSTMGSSVSANYFRAHCTNWRRMSCRFLGAQWHYIDKIWRHCCTGVQSFANFSSFLFSNVFGNRSVRGVAWHRILAGFTELRW